LDHSMYGSSNSVFISVSVRRGPQFGWLVCREFFKGRHASLVYPSLGLSPAVSDGVQLTSFEDTGGAKVRLCRPINSLRLSVNSPHLLFQRCRTKMFRGKGVSLLMILQVWHLTAPTCVKGLAIDRQRPSSQDPLR
jgi:hypothetical protein